MRPSSKEEIRNILEQHHDSSLAGHFGYIRTSKRINDIYKWPNMKRDITLVN